VERARADLRLGLPVLVHAGADALLALPAESASSHALEALARLGPVRLLLSLPRARTLKIRTYTDDAVAVAWEPGMSAETVRQLADPTRDLGNPLSGPFRALREPLPPAAPAVLALLKGAGLLPAAAAVHGARAKLGTAAEKAGLLSLSAADVLAYAQRALQQLEAVARAHVPLQGAENSEVIAFRGGDRGSEHLAIIVGEADRAHPVLVRLHSACFTGDLLGSLRCDCGDQLREALRRMADAAGGVLLYLAQEGRGIGLLNKLRAYSLQEQGFDTLEANERLGFAADERLFETAAAMLAVLGIGKVRLLTNNPAKSDKLKTLGIDVVERVPLVIPANEHNRRYLEAKAKSGHLL
jgi:GTP cyclohydrolase II